MSSRDRNSKSVLNIADHQPKKKKVNRDMNVDQFFDYASRLVDFEWKHHKKESSISKSRNKISSLEDLRCHCRIIPSIKKEPVTSQNPSDSVKK